MSVLTANSPAITRAKAATERRHRQILFTATLAAVLLNLALAVYGFDYYKLDAAHRALSPKYDLLKPGGIIGIRLGIFGAMLFLLIFLYAFRKRWVWLGRIGSTKHWLDFHILLGLTAPVIITFHSSFKFGGIAGIAYWIMIAVALSGIVGRYIYAQIPRSLGNAEMSFKEVQDLSQALGKELEAQKLISSKDLSPLLRPLDSASAQRMSAITMLFVMFERDVSHMFGICKLRRRALGFFGTLYTIGGIFPSRHRDLEAVIACVKKQASLSTRILFLSKTQDLFRFWHVVHRPFSYSFAVLVCIHITVVLLFGYA